MPKRAGDVWDHFQVIGGSGSKKHVICIYCNAEYKHSHATRMVLHMTKCKSCPIDIKSKFKKKTKSTILRNEPTSVNNNMVMISQSTNMGSDSENSIVGSYDDTYRSLDGSQLVHVVASPRTTVDAEDRSLVNKDEIDASIARAIYATAAPLSLLESMYWREALKCLNAEYEPPSRDYVRNDLLDAEYIRVKSQIEEKIDKSTALAIITDRSTNVKGEGVINFIVSTPDPIFFKSVYPECERETAEYLSTEIIKVIEEIGSSKIVSLITDNDKNIKTVWRLVQNVYPNIACIGCLAHAFNLIFNDICKLSTVKNCVDSVIKVITYVNNKNRALAFFENIQTTLYGTLKHTLKLPCKISLNSVVMTLESYKSNIKALNALGITKEINIERDIKNILLDDEKWLTVKNVLRVLKPIASALMHAESDDARVSDVPNIFLKLMASIEEQLHSSVKFLDTEKETIKSVILKRQNFCIQPIHLAANLLDPRYLGSDLTSDQESDANNYIYEQACFLSKDPVVVMTNVAEFRTKSAFFGKCHSAWITTETIAPHLWWQSFASKQELFLLAYRILSVPPTSAPAQRNRKSFANIYTKSKNHLEKEKVNKLLTVNQNLKYFDTTRYNNSASESDQSVDFEFFDSVDQVDEEDQDERGGTKLERLCYKLFK